MALPSVPQPSPPELKECCRAAVAEERERCAKIVEEKSGCRCEHRVTPKRHPHDDECPVHIAAAIRETL